jgi:ABC-type sugar transport system ATPase subunit
VSCIKLEGVKNRFVRVDDFFAPEGDICAVVGPSGSGKTSMLRIIAGLASHEGCVLFDDEEIQHKKSHERMAGFVNQDLHLFPHLTLEGNLYLAMHSLRIKRSKKLERIIELKELLRISHLSGRRPDTFSGGEKQRAALARVLASSPKVLLLDEPFSKLDFRTARYLRQEFRNLQKRLGLTTIIVTHDIQEARDMADSIWVMQNGVLASSIRSFTSETPHTENGDSFLEMPNVIECETLECFDNGIVRVGWEGGDLLIPHEGEVFKRFTIGRRKILLGIEPPEGAPINRFTGTIEDMNVKDDGVLISVITGNDSLLVEMPYDSCTRMGLTQGKKVHGYMRLRDLMVCS